MTSETRTYLISDDGGVAYFDDPQYVPEAVANGWHIVERETYERIRAGLLYPAQQIKREDHYA